MENEIKQELIYGRNAVTETLASGKTVDTLLVQKGLSLGKIIALAKQRGAVIKEASAEKLTALAETDKHGGVIAYISSADYCDIEDIISVSREKGTEPFIIIADGIEDPHNLGAIIRTAEAAGADGVIIPKRRSASVNATVYKTSAGAASWIKIARVSNLADAIKRLKKENIWIYGAEADGVSYNKANLAGGAALVIGSEGNGLGRLVRENCDMILSIPMFGKINSLNASVSAGILMYEIVNRRKK